MTRMFYIPLKTNQPIQHKIYWRTNQYINIRPHLLMRKGIDTMYQRINNKKVKWSRYRPGLSQSVGTGIAILFHDRDTRRGWVVSSTPRPHFNPRKDPVPILQWAGWAPGPIWTGGKSRPHRNSIPGRPARSQSLYRMSYPALLKRSTYPNTASVTYLLTYAMVQSPSW